MPEVPESPLLVLEELPFPSGQGSDVSEWWRFGIGRDASDETLAWLFQRRAETTFPRGYLDSVHQRQGLWAGLRALPGDVVVRVDESTPDSPLIAAFAPEGEPFLDYLARVPALSERVAWRLCLELIAWLKALIPVPRLLSNVDPTDFLVQARDGIVLSMGFCPVFCLLREETPLSDYRIARLWSERLAIIHAYLKGGRKGTPLGGSAADNKAFRTLFKHFDVGKDRTLGERLDEVAAIFRSEHEAASKGGTGPEAPLDRGQFPTGPLARLLARRAVESDPSRFAGKGGKSGGGGGGTAVFSAYRIDRVGSDPAAVRMAHLLPPESWFEASLIEPLNRRLSHPYLKAHHHCPRIRSVYCDEHLSLLVGDPAEAIPLPSLLSARGSLATGDLLLVLGKLHRALAQFESAGYDAGLISPWQVELRLETGVIHPGWKSLLAMEVAAWPAWEVLVRVERPAECFLPGETTSAWSGVRRLLEGKYFPALVAWMLDWKRFQWAARAGALDAEPITWDERLRPLFEAARDHLDPAQGAQREKFLALLEEGLMLD